MTTILLSTDEKKNRVYYLTSITEEQKVELFAAKKAETLEDLDILWGIACTNILKVGETAKITPGHLTEYVGKFPGYTTEGINTIRSTRPDHFRDYARTEEKQKEMSWLVNTFEDAASSVKSALRQMPDKYSVLWEVQIESTYKEEMDKLLKNKARCKMSL